MNTLSRNLFIAFAFLTMLAGGTHEVRAATYNVETDFSATANPNGVWSYGRYTTQNDSTTFTSFTTQTTNALTSVGASLGLNGHFIAPGLSFFGVWQNQSGSDMNFSSVHYPDNAVILHPGNGLNDQTVVRWTAPTGGNYSIASFFEGVDDGGPTPARFTTTDVSIFHNTASIFSGDIRGFGDLENFASILALMANDTLDFVVGRAPSVDIDAAFDSTRLGASITSVAPVPLPAAFPLLAGALGSMVLAGWRRKRRAAAV